MDAQYVDALLVGIRCLCLEIQIALPTCAVKTGRFMVLRIAQPAAQLAALRRRQIGSCSFRMCWPGSP